MEAKTSWDVADEERRSTIKSADDEEAEINDGEADINDERDRRRVKVSNQIGER